WRRRDYQALGPGDRQGAGHAPRPQPGRHLAGLRPGRSHAALQQHGPDGEDLEGRQRASRGKKVAEAARGSEEGATREGQAILAYAVRSPSAENKSGWIRCARISKLSTIRGPDRLK